MKNNDKAQQILQAAVKVAETKGYFNFIRKDIVEEIGISDGLIQYYYHTMGDLRKAVLKEAIRTENLNIIAHFAVFASSERGDIPAVLLEKSLYYNLNRERA